MNIRNIQSHQEMLSLIPASGRSYVLLYKKGAEASECSYKSIGEALNDLKDLQVLAADVNNVRDIHPVYELTSAPSLLVFEGTKYVKTVKGCNDKGFYKSLFKNAMFSATVRTDGKPPKRVTVYSTPTCSWCTTLKTHLKKHGVRYQEIDVSRDEAAAKAMVAKSGQQGVPQTDINGHMIIGFDKNKINSLLEIKQNV